MQKSEKRLLVVVFGTMELLFILAGIILLNPCLVLMAFVFGVISSIILLHEGETLRGSLGLFLSPVGCALAMFLIVLLFFSYVLIGCGNFLMEIGKTLSEMKSASYSVLVKCYGCNGTGKVDCPYCINGRVAHNRVCPFCRGWGYFICSMCKGTGKNPYYQSK